MPRTRAGPRPPGVAVGVVVSRAVSLDSVATAWGERRAQAPVATGSPVILQQNDMHGLGRPPGPIPDVAPSQHSFVREAASTGDAPAAVQDVPSPVVALS